jgi:hypothetical protein
MEEPLFFGSPAPEYPHLPQALHHHPLFGSSTLICEQILRICLILIQYVDNSGIRYNCRELVDEFYAAVRDDGRIDLNFVGKLTWWLGVRYTYSLVTGAISADQEAFIDQLLEQYAMPNATRAFYR